MVDYITTIDADTMLKKKRVQTLVEVYKAINKPNTVLTGFNISTTHPILGCTTYSQECDHEGKFCAFGIHSILHDTFDFAEDF